MPATEAGGPATLRAARPVTPVGIAAQQLELALAELEEVAGVPAETFARLRRAHRLVGGLDPYVAACTTAETEALRRLAELTAAEDWDRREALVALEQEMISGHVEGQFLKALVHATGARRVLEVGMFTGYSALAMAEALPDGGRLVACELDPGAAAFARGVWADSPAGARIEVRVGPAAESLLALDAEGERFDLVFIDADKSGYGGYLDQLLTGGLLAADGLVCVDNTLLQGEPWTEGEPSGPGAAIARFNAELAVDPRVDQVLVPIRDGVTLIWRTAPR